MGIICSDFSSGSLFTYTAGLYSVVVPNDVPPCPVCHKPLREQLQYGQLVDRCDNCNGVFYDRYELGDIVRLVRLYNENAIDEPDIDTVHTEEHHRILPCPKDGTGMDKKRIGHVDVDMCGLCRGVWLDAGEIISLMNVQDHIIANMNLYVRLASTDPEEQ